MSSATAETATSPTPILDCQAPLPPPTGMASGSGMLLVAWLGLVFASAFLMVWNPPLVRYLGRRLIVDFGQIQPDPWKMTGFLFVVLGAASMFFLAILIHELGHVLVGLWVGFSFHSLRVGRLQFDRPFRISLYRGKGTGAGGWASMFPVKEDKLPLRAAAMIFAGPAANLLSVAVMFLFPLSPGPVSDSFTLLSLILGVINLLPFRSRAIHSDGSRILMLLRNRARGERWVAMLKLAAELRDGVMPEVRSSAYLAKATALRDKSPDTVSAYSFAYSTAFHQHKDAESAQALEVCLQYAGYAAPVMRQSLMSDAAVLQARRMKRVDLARQWLAAMPETTEHKWLRTRAEAAIFEAQGDITDALTKLDEAEKQILATPSPLQREIALRYLRRWKAEVEDPRAAQAAGSGTALRSPLL